MTSRTRLAPSVLVVLAALLAGCSTGVSAPDDPEPVAAADADVVPAAGDADAQAEADAEEQARREAEEQAEAEAEARAREEAEAQAAAEAEAEAEAQRRAEEEARRRAEEEAQRRADTTRVQEVLAAHGYYAGPVDGDAGPATSAAVMAFQKVHGLSRDGAIGPQTLAAIEAPSPAPLVGGAATRIEVDLDRQVVNVVLGGQHVRTLNASSGNGEVYTWPDGRVARADTPVGTFTIQRRITGLREGDLGAMYDPLYFHEGWAIHGSNSVPGYPASHGCVRLTRADATWLAAHVPDGTQVVVHGSVNAFDPRTESVWL